MRSNCPFVDIGGTVGHHCFIIKPTRTTRFHHPKRYIQIRPKKDVYKYSFLPRYRDWNQLSVELLDIESSEEFKSRLTKLFYRENNEQSPRDFMQKKLK
jgi:hypothetical protein